MIFLICAAALSLFLRMGLAFESRDSFQERGNRYSTIVPTVHNLLDGHGFSVKPGAATAINEPGYIIVLSLVEVTTGLNWFGLTLFHYILSIIGAFFLLRLSALFGLDTRVSVLAAGLFLLYPFYVSQSVSVIDSTLFITLLAVFVYGMARLRLHADWKIVAWTGATIASLLLTRQGSLSIIVGVMLLFLLWTQGNSRSIIIVFGLAGAAALIMAPWLVRNYSHTGKVFISTHGAAELWFGYNDSTRSVLERDVTVDIMRRYSDDMIADLHVLPADVESKPLLAEYESGKKYSSAAIDYILEDPLRAVRMMPLKLWKFWSWNKNPRTNSLDPNRSLRSELWDILYTLYFLPLLALSVIGSYFIYRLNKFGFALVVTILTSYSFMHMLVYGFTRLRTPLDQFIILLASLALIRIIDAARRKWRPLRPVVGE